jgi:exonuclease SbcD
MMKLGISADLHLANKNQYPERYNAFTDILDQCLDQGVNYFILAGDVFDQSMQNYSDFESICNNKKYSSLDIHIIPGNHDPEISNKKIVCKNVNIHSNAEWVPVCDGWTILFIPYKKSRLMGEMIQELMVDRPEGKWILVGHGDLSQGLQTPNAYEPGIYMPLTQRDILQFHPDLIFLGHIHVKHQIGNLHYPGSPCGLDITETGYRHFLVLDTETNQVAFKRVNTDRLLFNEELLILPKEDEDRYLEEQIDKLTSGWMISPGDEKKVKVRMKVRGFSTNRENIIKVIRKGLQAYSLYDEPDISEVSNANDPEKDYLMTKFLENLGDYELPKGQDDPGEEEIILEAMKLIYMER